MALKRGRGLATPTSLRHDGALQGHARPLRQVRRLADGERCRVLCQLQVQALHLRRQRSLNVWLARPPQRGAKGCWARGCLRNGGEPETLTASQLRNRISNIRPRQRERAQREEEQREAMLSQERRAQAAAAETRGLKTCLRAETGRREGAPTKRLSWAAPYPPSGRPLGDCKMPASVREPLFWDNPGKQADCDKCGCRCDPHADGAFQGVPRRSRFARTEVLCPVCAEDLGCRALCAMCLISCTRFTSVIFFKRKETLNVCSV